MCHVLQSTVMCRCVVCYRAQMKKVMVTVLRHNAAAHEFFLNKLKYVLIITTTLFMVLSS